MQPYFARESLRSHGGREVDQAARSGPGVSISGRTVGSTECLLSAAGHRLPAKRVALSRRRPGCGATPRRLEPPGCATPHSVARGQPGKCRLNTIGDLPGTTQPEQPLQHMDAGPSSPVTCANWEFPICICRQFWPAVREATTATMSPIPRASTPSWAAKKTLPPCKPNCKIAEWVCCSTSCPIIWRPAQRILGGWMCSKTVPSPPSPRSSISNGIPTPLQHTTVNSFPSWDVRSARRSTRARLSTHFRKSRFFFNISVHYLPLTPRSYHAILNHRYDRLKQLLGEDAPAFHEYSGIIASVSELPGADRRSAETSADRRLRFESARDRLRSLMSSSPEVAAFVGENVAEINGKTRRCRQC